MRTVQRLYNEPKNQLGAKRPLFDRLIDENPEEQIDSAHNLILTRQQLIESIAVEVSRILNTRSTAKYQDYEDLTGDTLSLGFPSLFGFRDFQSFDASNRSEWPRIANLCQQAISYFEPRLSEVTVQIQKFHPSTQTLELEISGFLQLDKFREAVYFPVVWDWN